MEDGYGEVGGLIPMDIFHFPLLKEDRLNEGLDVW